MLLNILLDANIDKGRSGLPRQQVHDTRPNTDLPSPRHAPRSVRMPAPPHAGLPHREATSCLGWSSRVGHQPPAVGPLGVRVSDRAGRRCGAGAPPAARPHPQAGGRGDRRRARRLARPGLRRRARARPARELGLVVAGGLLEVASVAGYVLLLHRVVSGASPRLRWRDSYDIALAGTAVTRLLPTAGLGGAAVTVWALPVCAPASSPSACSPSSSCYFLGTTCNVLPLPGSLSGGLAGALVALGTPAAPRSRRCWPTAPWPCGCPPRRACSRWRACARPWRPYAVRSRWAYRPHRRRPPELPLERPAAARVRGLRGRRRGGRRRGGARAGEHPGAGPDPPRRATARPRWLRGPWADHRRTIASGSRS